MSDILISGMEMPKNCEQCWFFGSDSADIGYCYMLKGKLPMPDGMPQDCPLIEIKPHGDLIDRDALKEAFCGNCFADEKPMECSEPCIDMRIILEAPTIIKAEDCIHYKTCYKLRDEMNGKEKEEYMAKLYTLYRESENGNLTVEGYAYGDEWVSQALFMGDWKYPTPEAAKEAWEQWLERGDKK